MPVVNELSNRITGDSQQFINELDRAERAVRKSTGQIGSAYNRIAAESAASASVVNSSAGRMRASIGNVAQQVQDIAVQYQMGTNAAIIFAQQGPQIAGAFGPAGAAIGAVAAVIAVGASAMFGLGKEAKATADVLGNVLSSAFDDNTSAARRYAESLKAATHEQREFAKSIAELKIISSRQAAADVISNLSPIDNSARRQAFEKVPQINSFGQAGFREGRQRAEAQQGIATDIRGQLQAAVDAGDPNKVFALAKQFGLITQDTAPAIQRLAEIARAIELDKLIAENDQAGLTKIAGPTKSETTRAERIAIKEVSARDDLIRSVSRERDELERLAAVGRESVEVRIDMADTIAAENAVIKAGFDVKDDEAKRLIAEIKFNKELKRRIDETNRARKQAATSTLQQNTGGLVSQEDAFKLSNTADDEFQRQAESSAKALREQMQGELAKGFEGAFRTFREEGDFAVVDLVDNLVKQFETIPDKLAAGFFTGLTDKTFDAMEKALAQFGNDPSLAAFSELVQNPVVAGTLGIAAGQLANNALGRENNPGASAGGLAGTIIGGAIGSYYGQTALGAAAGGAIGTVAGSTFGGSNNRANAYLNPQTGAFKQDNSPGRNDPNRQAVEAITLAARDFARLAREDFGVSFDRQVRVRVDKRIAPYNAELNAVRDIQNAANSNDPVVARILKNSRAENFAQLQQDIEFADIFNQFGKNPLELQIQKIRDQFEQVRDDASRLGLDVNPINNESSRQIEEVTGTFRDQIRLLVGRIGQFDLAMSDLNKRFAEGALVANEFEVTESQLAAARLKAIGDLAFQAELSIVALQDQFDSLLQQEFGSKIDAITQTINGLQFGPNSPLNVADQLPMLQNQFDQQRALFESGQISDVAGILQLGQQVVQAARETFGSTNGFQDIFREVNSALVEVQGGLQDRQAAISDKLGDRIEISNERQADKIVDAIDDLKEQFARLNRELAA